jgi:urease accessory protein
METMLQGAAFLEAARQWTMARLSRPACAPIASPSVPWRARMASRPRQPSRPILQAFASNQVQAAIRLSVIGQKDGVGIVVELEPEIGRGE